MTGDVVAELDRAIADPFGWHTAVIQRARTEIVALRARLDRQPQGMDAIAHVRAEARAEALEAAARVCEGGYTTGSTASTLKAIAAAIRALKDKA